MSTHTYTLLVGPYIPKFVNFLDEREDKSLPVFNVSLKIPKQLVILTSDSPTKYHLVYPLSLKTPSFPLSKCERCILVISLNDPFESRPYRSIISSLPISMQNNLIIFAFLDTDVSFHAQNIRDFLAWGKRYDPIIRITSSDTIGDDAARICIGQKVSPDECSPPPPSPPPPSD